MRDSGLSQYLDLKELKSFSIVKWGYTEESEPQTLDHYLRWVNEGNAEPLNYLTDHRKDLRKDIKNFYPEFQSALVFLFSYKESKKSLESFYKSKDSNGLKVASYVAGFNGEDYHFYLKKKLDEIAKDLELKVAGLETKLTLDIHPVLERDLAYRSGLGWFGKNSMLINRDEGSYTIIGSLLLNKKLELDEPQIEVDHCGSCRRCIDACPTDAISESSRQIIANKCISTYTIEFFKESPEISGHKEASNGEVFGCDICQEVCPWNFKPIEMAKEGTLEDNLVVSEFLTGPISEVYDKVYKLSNKAFVRMFKHTPLARTGRKGLLKNLKLFK